MSAGAGRLVAAIVSVSVLGLTCTPIPQPDGDSRTELADWEPPGVGDPFPAFDLRDGRDERADLSSILGRPGVVSFVSFDPGGSGRGSQRILERMAELPERLPDVRARLTAVRLTPFAGRPPDPVELLTGERDHVLTLAATFGIGVDRGDGGPEHGHVTIVIDRGGIIAAIFRGHTSWDAGDLAAAVAAAAGR